MKVAVSTSLRGYQLTASTCLAHGALHAEDLVIERHGRRQEVFAALDYSFDHDQALRYTTHCGRIWVDSKTRIRR
ncbi:hypothetical protein B0G84_8618 [Paraburkholderia sp. BL8N3]|nr:hypothetical protein B0G84_8618 [Paraburkholderia sp. BL8N3]